MKKRNIMLLTSMMLAVLLIAGGTFAWFTASADPIVNEFTAGTMDIEIHEEFEPVTNLNPGDCYEKVIYVENTGTKRAYIRIKADTLWTPRSGINASELSNMVISYGINAPYTEWTYEWWDIFHLFGNCELVPGWEYIDGYFYYNKIVPANGFTKPLLKCNRICFNGPMMGNEYQGAKLDITINAEAIQATHNAMNAEWGVSFGGNAARGTNAESEVEEFLTIDDVQRIIEEEEAAFEALEQ